LLSLKAVVREPMVGSLRLKQAGIEMALYKIAEVWATRYEITR
jgi:hypothetical protein